MTRQTPFLTEPQWHQGQSPRLCPLWLQGPSCLPFSFSWRSFTISRPLQPGVGLLRRLCHPSHTLAFSRPLTRQGGIGLPKFRDVQRIEVPLARLYPFIAICVTIDRQCNPVCSSTERMAMLSLPIAFSSAIGV